MVTSEQVARLAGVSRATVSRALNGSAHVSEETRERIQAAIAALGYEPDVVARSLVRQRSHVLAISLFPEDDNERFLAHLGQTSQYLYLDILKNIEREARSVGYDLLVPSRPLGHSPKHYIQSLQTRRVAGVIMLHATEERIQALIDSDLPTVFVDRIAQGKRATYVKSDNMDGARQATEHLLSLGHRRVAILTGKTDNIVGMERLQGFQQALTQAGITPDPGLVCHSGWNIAEAYEAAKALLAERRDFTAIVAASDMIAMGGLRALTEQGLRVPEDISLVGFDDVELSQYTYPPLTTMRQDCTAMGQGAVQRLMCLLEETEDAAPLNIPTRLVIRQSTAPLRL